MFQDSKSHTCRQSWYRLESSGSENLQMIPFTRAKTSKANLTIQSSPTWSRQPAARQIEKLALALTPSPSLKDELIWTARRLVETVGRPPHALQKFSLTVLGTLVFGICRYSVFRYKASRIRLAQHKP